jgi:hypothetical protein
LKMDNLPCRFCCKPWKMLTFSSCSLSAWLIHITSSAAFSGLWFQHEFRFKEVLCCFSVPRLCGSWVSLGLGLFLCRTAGPFP